MMSKLFYLSVVGVLVAMTFPAQASISYETNMSASVASYNYQITDFQVAMDDDYRSASGFGPMNLSTSTSYGAVLSGSSQFTGTYGAEQATAVAALSASNDLDNQWGPGSGGASGSASWDFKFNLAEEQAWSLTGTAGANLQGSSIALYGYDTNGNSFNIFFQDIGFASSTQVIDAGGTLAAGRYWMYVTSQLSAYQPHTSKTSGYDLTFAVSETPEPASLGLVALGVVAMMRRR